MRFHTQTAGVSLTWQQPLVNVARTAIEALAAVLGGTQSLHTNSYDEALALPTEDAVRLALRTQQVIAHETGVVNTIDPLGGSYHVEALTNRLEEEAYELLPAGSTSSAGWSPRSRRTCPSARSPRRRTATSRRSRADERIVVGVNRYRTEDDEEIHILRIDPDLERKQIERLRAFKARRDSAAVEQRLAGALGGGVRVPDRNLMPVIVDAVRDGVTLGEICDAWRQRLGHLARAARLLAREAGFRSRGIPPLDPRLRRGTSLKASAVAVAAASVPGGVGGSVRDTLAAARPWAGAWLQPRTLVRQSRSATCNTS